MKKGHYSQLFFIIIPLLLIISLPFSYYIYLFFSLLLLLLSLLILKFTATFLPLPRFSHALSHMYDFAMPLILNDSTMPYCAMPYLSLAFNTPLNKKYDEDSCSYFVNTPKSLLHKIYCYLPSSWPPKGMICYFNILN